MRTLKQALLHIRPDGTVEARILPDDAPAGCGSADGCAGCSGCAGAAVAPGAGLVVPLPGVAGRQEGERVEVWLQTPGQTVSGLVMLALPLACALGGGMLANALLNDSWLLPGGGAGLAAGFGIVYLLCKRWLAVSATLADAR